MKKESVSVPESLAKSSCKLYPKKNDLSYRDKDSKSALDMSIYDELIENIVKEIGTLEGKILFESKVISLEFNFEDIPLKLPKVEIENKKKEAYKNISYYYSNIVRLKETIKYYEQTKKFCYQMEQNPNSAFLYNPSMGQAEKINELIQKNNILTAGALAEDLKVPIKLIEMCINKKYIETIKFNDKEYIDTLNRRNLYCIWKIKNRHCLSKT